MDRRVAVTPGIQYVLKLETGDCFDIDVLRLVS